ncbi:MAG: hypothetical protein KF831_02230 [Acidobacteria bacterium]|nr:hypothetical protein [Acidobacteriota bacterium]
MERLRKFRLALLVVLLVSSATVAGAYFGYELAGVEGSSFRVFHSRFDYIAQQVTLVCFCTGIWAMMTLLERQLFWLSQVVSSFVIVFTSINVWKLFAQMTFSFSTEDALASIDTRFLPWMYISLGSWIALVIFQAVTVALRVFKRTND